MKVLVETKANGGRYQEERIFQTDSHAEAFLAYYIRE